MLVWKKLPSKEVIRERRKAFEDRVRVANAFWNLSRDFHLKRRKAESVRDSCDFWLGMTDLRPAVMRRLKALREKAK